MPGPLQHSPADISSRVLISEAVGTDPDDANEDVDVEDWPIHVGNEPDNPDNCITVYDTAGKSHGRSHIDGETFEHHGIQVKVRSQSYSIGYAKAREIAVAMDTSVYDELLTIDTANYRFHSFTRVSDVLSIGNDPNRESVSFTINALVSVRQLS